MSDIWRLDSDQYHLEPAEWLLDPQLQFTTPVFSEVLALWQDMRGAREMPMRGDFSPTMLPPRLLSQISMVDIDRSGPEPRFRWRLLGTGITRRVGRDSTGCYWDELYEAETLDWFAASTHWIMEHRRPMREVSSMPVPGRGFLIGESLEMPFSEDGENVSMTLAVTIFL